jgi:hypothetical protein
VNEEGFQQKFLWKKILELCWILMMMAEKNRL